MKPKRLPASTLPMDPIERSAETGALMGGFMGSLAGSLMGAGVKQILEPSIAAGEIASAIEALIDAKLKDPDPLELINTPVHDARAKLRKVIQDHLVPRRTL